MNPLRLTVRFPLESAPDDLEPAIAVFHRFIQRGLVEGLVLDVADYRHVPTGPGVMLMGHDVDYGISGDAFTVVRKRRSDDDVATQFRDALRMGLAALEAIAEDGGLDVIVDRSRLYVSVQDRRLGATDGVGPALREALQPVVTEVHGGDAQLEVATPDDPRQPPVVRIEVEPEATTAVLERLGGSRAPGQSPWDVTVEELARLRDGAEDFVLLDVREPSEYETVNLGGRLAPLAELGEHLGDLDRDARILVHCRAGLRGAKAVAQLREAGFSDAWNVNGGLMTWIDRIDASLTRY